MTVSTRINLAAVAFALILPTAVTWVYFVALARSPSTLQQGAYAVGKAIQFAFPAVWTFLVLREKPRWTRPTGRGLLMGLAFGLTVGGLMVVLTFGWLKPLGFFDGPADQIRSKIQGLGLDSPWKYILLGVFYALCHSFLEEYYWRWFVFRRLRVEFDFVTAATISSVGFMAHHVILLATYFGWASPATYLFSIAIAIGGAFWAWLYERTGSLCGPWLSHMLVDAAIFVVGFELARDLFT